MLEHYQNERNHNKSFKNVTKIVLKIIGYRSNSIQYAL